MAEGGQGTAILAEGNDIQQNIEGGIVNVVAGGQIHRNQCNIATRTGQVQVERRGQPGSAALAEADKVDQRFTNSEVNVVGRDLIQGDVYHTYYITQVSNLPNQGNIHSGSDISNSGSSLRRETGSAAKRSDSPGPRSVNESSALVGCLSQAEACDVLIFYHHNSNMKDPVEEAVDLLQQNQLSVRGSHQLTSATEPATQDLYLSSALSSRFRIFVMNASFVKHDLPRCHGILFNRSVCSVQNTLFVCREAHRKKIPEALAHITVKPLSNRANGSEIAENVLRFIDENKSVTVIPVDQTESSQVSEEDQSKEAEKKRLFLDAMERFDRKKLYALCVCVKPVRSNSNICDALSLIHWPKVFDFDTDTNTSGLYSIVKDKLPKGRLNFLTTQDKVSEIRQNIINWTAISDNEDDDGELGRHISSLAKFCSGRKPATMLILWYVEKECDELMEDLRDFISNVKFCFRNRKIKFVLCLPEVHDGKTDLSAIICRRYQCHGTIAPLATVCDWILGLADELAISEQVTTARLPKLKECDEDDDTFELKPEDFDWVTVDLRVLAVSSPLSPTKSQEDKVHQNGIEFLKGGEITWDVMERGQFVVCRDKLNDIHSHIHHLVQNGQSCIVTLYHAPGSGGSTLGRQVLWSFRKIVPCLALETKSQIQDDFKEKIKMIRDQSHLPVLLLIDGRSSQEARTILDMCRYEKVIILQVLRQYYSAVKKQVKKGFFYLPDTVSAKEAPKFKSILIKNGTAGIKKAMQKLTKDIEEETCHHSVFEYGLAAFNLDFRGIGKYVESHLRLQNKNENWHKVAAMLSLANYYGNRSLPSEFFFNILEKKGFESVNMAYDIPELGQQLIRECSDGDEWKISHYLVAKEILQQFLGGDASDSNKAQLSLAARRKLPYLAGEFLRYMKEHEGEGYTLHDDLLSILKDVFILRNDRDDEEEEDDEPKRRQTFARLITDICGEDQQREVFTMLVKSFPSNAEFHAHFGRFLAKCSRHREAEGALKRAITIRRDSLEKSGVDVAVRGDDVLQRIHNMCGFAYNDHLREIFGNKAVGFMAGDTYAHLSISKINEAFTIAQAAIEEFRRSRYYYCPSANQSYAYMGEIKARLWVTEFCWKQTCYELILISNAGHRLNLLWNFIVESFAECECLLDQCIDKYGSSRKVQQDLHKLLSIFTRCYSGESPYHLKNFMERMDPASFSFKRCQITYLRLLHARKGAKREFQVIPDLPSPKFEHYARLLESVINDRDSSKIRISPYMDDWIKISRHLAQPVPLNIAKSFVDDWDKRKEKESFSSFYRYVIQFAITLFDLTPANRAHLKECKERLEQCQRYLKLNVVEVPIERVRSIDGQRKFSLTLLKNYKNTQEEPLQDFVGEVVDAKWWSGKIAIRGTGLEVFFVPQKANVRRFHATSRQLVRFSLGFNAKRGAQAYDVTLMSTYTCPTCRYQVVCESENFDLVKCAVCPQASSVIS